MEESPSPGLQFVHVNWAAERKAEQEAERRKASKSLGYWCPHCKAIAGEPCRLPGGQLYRDRIDGKWFTRYHAARARAAGVKGLWHAADDP